MINILYIFLLIISAVALFSMTEIVSTEYLSGDGAKELHKEVKGTLEGTPELDEQTSPKKETQVNTKNTETLSYKSNTFTLVKSKDYQYPFCKHFI